MNETLAIARAYFRPIRYADKIDMFIVAKTVVEILSWSDQQRLDQFPSLKEVALVSYPFSIIVLLDHTCQMMTTSPAATSRFVDHIQIDGFLRQVRWWMMGVPRNDKCDQWARQD